MARVALGLMVIAMTVAVTASNHAVQGVHDTAAKGRGHDDGHTDLCKSIDRSHAALLGRIIRSPV